MDGFRVEIDKNRMFVKLIAGNNIVDAIQSEEELLGYLKKNRVFKGVQRNEILRAFVEMHDIYEPTEYIIARGKRPVPGKNGYLEFKIDISGKAHYFAPTESDDDLPVDYKSAIGLPVVARGECICVVHKPTAGSDGYDINGKLLTASDGKAVQINLGSGVAYDDSGTRVMSTEDGRPIYQNDKLSVTPIYEIRGDICFETGNINFDGHVVILGSVQDTFSVEAESIEIKGCVGDSFIKARKELIIYGGVNGKNTESEKAGYIKCQGDVLVKYLNDCNLEVDGDLVVRKEIVNSAVKCNGRVNAACIIGGVTTTLKGLDVAVLGSQLGVPTAVEVGVNYRVKYYEEALASLSWQIDSMIEPLKVHLGDNRYFRKIVAHQQQRFIDEYDNFIGIKSGYLNLLAQRAKLIKNETLAAVREVIVRKRLYSDITVSTPSCKKTFINEFEGPIILQESLQYKSIKASSYVDPSKNAEAYEQLKSERRKNIRPSSKGAFKIRAFNSKRFIYTYEGIENIDKKFYLTIKGQDFAVCIYEDRFAKRQVLYNYLRKVGVENLYAVKDDFQALEMLKELEEQKKLIMILNLHIGERDGLKFVSNLLHKAPNNYGIFLTNHINPALKAAVDKIEALEIIHEDNDPDVIVKKIRDFGMIF